MTGQNVFIKITTNALSLTDELNSEIFYKNLNDLGVLKEFNAYCEPLRTLERGVSVKIICAQMLNYLKTKYSTPGNQNDKYDACTLFNYWLYNRLNITYNYGNYSKLIQAFGELQNIWSEFIHKELDKENPDICNPIFNIALETDWQERKELLGYCSDVNDLRNTTYSYPTTCNKYYEYIKSKTELYKEYERVCDSPNKDKCPKFFDKCRVYNPEVVLRTLRCHTEMEGTKASASEKDITKERENPEQPVSLALSVGTPSSNGNPKTVENVGNILLGVVATTMTSGALYRFTPLGGMIRNGLGWNTNNMSNINGGDIRLYEYASEPFNPHPGEEHYIGYHPA